MPETQVDQTNNAVGAPGSRPQMGNKITEELLADMRSRIGRKRPSDRPWNSGAAFDTIHHFAEGIGDLNPLWVDPEYGKASAWGAQQAPPTYLYTLGLNFGGGMKGIHGFGGGSAFTFFQPIYAGDQVSSTIELIDLIERKTRHSDRMFQQLERMEYTNQRGELVAEAEHWVMRFERDQARQISDEDGGRYLGRQLTRYTPEGIKGIDAEYAREQPRGGEALHWEDVDVGDYVPQIVKGPLRLTDIICYMMGGGGPYARGHRVNWEFRQRHPRVYIPNPQGVPDVAEAVHWEPWLAEGIATPGVYDYGTERPSWMAHCLTNWIGDHGWIEYLRAELRAVNVVGDTTHVGGRVTGKRVEDGKHLVDLEMWCRNQLGEVTVKGEARVRLPGREANDPGAAPQLSLATREANQAR